ncbi:hypothetical protein OAB47_06630 [Vicingaceae bacterium]|nr:hypothetical protein [Vicingaceae bacterium]
MKKTIVFAGLLSTLLIGCGAPAVEETKDESTENAKMDSIANELNQTAKEIDAASGELDNIINEL